MAFQALAISAGVSFGCGVVGYAIEESMNNRPIYADAALIHGAYVGLERMIWAFGVGGVSGPWGNVGTKGSFLSQEWWMNRRRDSVASVLHIMD